SEPPDAVIDMHHQLARLQVAEEGVAGGRAGLLDRATDLAPAEQLAVRVDREPERLAAPPFWQGAVYQRQPSFGCRLLPLGGQADGRRNVDMAFGQQLLESRGLLRDDHDRLAAAHG